MAVEGKQRDQLNISLTRDSPLARKLYAAEQATGQPRAQIARAVLTTFLDTWLQVEQSRRRLVDAATQAAGTRVVTVRDRGVLRPPYRGDEYQPAPDYWQAVETRRPMPRPVIGRQTDLPVRRVSEQRPPVRSVEPGRTFFDDEAETNA